jgi:hypothetical protein
VRFIAGWEENSAMPGKAPAAGEWLPMPWDGASNTLSDQLLRNLDLWSRPGTREQYEAALVALESATEEEYPRGLVIRCRDHTLSITPDPTLLLTSELYH